jgi:AAA+ ATPase superfamily predicted ATPase
MIKRTYEKKVLNFLEKFPIVAILGARQVGKTTLAKFIKDKYYKDAIYLDLEYPPDLSKLENPEIFLSQFEDKLIIIDEIQRIAVLVSTPSAPSSIAAAASDAQPMPASTMTGTLTASRTKTTL